MKLIIEKSHILKSLKMAVYMYVSKGVSREEWMWRGVAIAMCLAMVGIAVMPLAVGDIAAYCAGAGEGPYLSYDLVFTSVGLLKLTDIALLLELAGSTIAFPLAVGLVAESIAVAA